MQNVGERKKYLASTYPKEINSWGIKGLKKKFMPIPDHPTPPSEVKWLAPKGIHFELAGVSSYREFELLRVKLQ